MKYLLFAIKTFFFTILSILIAVILVAYSRTPSTQTKKNTEYIFTAETTPVRGYIDNREKNIRIIIERPKNLGGGLVYPEMKGYSAETEKCLRAKQACPEFIYLELSGIGDGASDKALDNIKKSYKASAGEPDNTGLTRHETVGREYYAGRIVDKSCYGDSLKRTILYNCNLSYLNSVHGTPQRLCDAFGTYNVDGVRFSYRFNYVFLRDWKKIHHSLCRLTRSFVVGKEKIPQPEPPK